MAPVLECVLGVIIINPACPTTWQTLATSETNTHKERIEQRLGPKRRSPGHAK